MKDEDKIKIVDSDPMEKLDTFLDNRLTDEGFLPESEGTPTTEETVDISLAEAIEKMEAQLKLLDVFEGPTQELCVALKKYKIPNNRCIDKTELTPDKIIELVHVQDDIVNVAMKVLVDCKDSETIILLQRVLNLHRHTLDGSGIVEHPIELVRECVDFIRLPHPEPVVEENYLTLEEYHCTIVAQTKIILSRQEHINAGDLTPDEGVEDFVAMMEEVGEVRRNGTLTMSIFGGTESQEATNISSVDDDMAELVKFAHVAVAHLIRAPEELVARFYQSIGCVAKCVPPQVHEERPTAHDDRECPNPLFVITGVALVIFVVAFVWNVITSD